MKTHLRMIVSAAALALGTSSAAFAAYGDASTRPLSAPVQTIAEPVADVCASFYSYGYTVMSNRQLGVPLPKMIEVNHSNPDESSEVVALLDKIVFAAYGEPRFSTPEIQERRAVDFANEVYLICATELNQ